MTLIEIVCTAIGIVITVALGVAYLLDTFETRKAPEPLLGVVLPKDEAHKKSENK
jgi:hypothetical protein